MRAVSAFILIFSLLMIGCGGSVADSNTPSTGDANANVAAAVNVAEMTDPKLALTEGNRLLDENQTESAIAALQRAVELDPDLAEAHFKLGIAHALLEMQREQSGEFVETSANSNSKEGPPKTESEKAFERAVAGYNKWLQANPKDDSAHYFLGRTYAKLMKDEEAEDAFREAVKLKPEDTEYQTELGAILIKLAKYREAIVPLKKAIELDAANGRAIDLLEDAEAGRRRVDYVSSNKNANTALGKNTNANSNSASTSNTASGPGEIKSPAGNSTTRRPEPAPTGRKEEPPRPRPVPTRPNQ